MDEHSHYVTNRLAIWCPCCGASEGEACNSIVGGPRHKGHDSYVGRTPTPVVAMPHNPVLKLRHFQTQRD